MPELQKIASLIEHSAAEFKKGDVVVPPGQVRRSATLTAPHMHRGRSEHGSMADLGCARLCGWAVRQAGLFMVKQGMAEQDDDRGAGIRLLKSFDFVGVSTTTTSSSSERLIRKCSRHGAACLSVGALPTCLPPGWVCVLQEESLLEDGSQAAAPSGPVVAMTSVVVMMSVKPADITAALGRPLREAVEEAQARWGWAAPADEAEAGMRRRSR